MKTQFTPGTWLWQIEYDRSVTVNSENERLARFAGNLKTDIPNAKLIAAAPSLYAACECMEAAMQDADDSGEIDALRMQDAMAEIAAALAMARGRA